MTMRDQTANRASDDVHEMLSRAQPEQIARLIRDVMLPQPTHEGATAHDQ